jgi:hypothetical protein
MSVAKAALTQNPIGLSIVWYQVLFYGPSSHSLIAGFQIYKQPSSKVASTLTAIGRGIAKGSREDEDLLCRGPD